MQMLRMLVALTAMHLMIGRAMAFAGPVLSTTFGNMRHLQQQGRRPQGGTPRSRRGVVTAVMPLPLESEDVETFSLAYALSPMLAMAAFTVRKGVTQGLASSQRNEKDHRIQHKSLKKAALHSSSVACSMYFHFLRESDQGDLSDMARPQSHRPESRLPDMMDAHDGYQTATLSR